MKSTTIPNRSNVFHLTVPQVKVRKPFAPAERVMKSKRNYNRQSFKRGIYE